VVKEHRHPNGGLPRRTLARLRPDPRADLPGFLQLLRRLGLRGWIYGVTPQLAAALEPQLEKHGGPIAFIEGESGWQLRRRREPVKRLSATSASSLLESRKRSPAVMDRCSGRT